MGGSHPWSKFFWSDYDADEGLRMCSLAAQGLWMRMLCLMARAYPKGELRVGAKPCTIADLSRLTGEREETVVELVGELEQRGVFSRNRADIPYNRRLRKDVELAGKRAKAGAKGAAVTNLKTKQNPDLLRQNSGKPPGKAPGPRIQNPESPPDPPHRGARARQDGGDPGGRYISESGHIYASSDPAEVMREANARADWTTYHLAKRELETSQKRKAGRP